MPTVIPWILAGLFAGAAASAASLDEGDAALRSSDYRKAYAIWLPFAEAGNCAAQFAIADLLQSAGDPFAELQIDPAWLATVAGEPAEATMLEWLLRAALQGHVEAQARLGYGYKTGYRIPYNQVRALYWYRRAANQGNRQSMYQLRQELLETAPAEALFWSLLLDREGWVAGDTRWAIDVLRNRLSPADSADIEQRAREWLPVQEAVPSCQTRDMAK